MGHRDQILSLEQAHHVHTNHPSCSRRSGVWSARDGRSRCDVLRIGSSSWMRSRPVRTRDAYRLPLSI